MYPIQAEERRTGKVAMLITSVITMIIALVLYCWTIDRAAKQKELIQSPQEDELTLTDISGINPSAGEALSQETKHSSPHVLATKEHAARTGESPVLEERSTSAASNELSEALSTFSQSRGTSRTTGTNPTGRSTTGIPSIGQENVKLKGRVMIQSPEAVTDLYEEEGKVVVAIIVDEKGNVVQAEPGEPGSTTTSAALYQQARKAAMTAKFDPSKEGIHEQHGTITFVFVLK